MQSIFHFFAELVALQALDMFFLVLDLELVILLLLLLYLLTKYGLFLLLGVGPSVSFESCADEFMRLQVFAGLVGLVGPIIGSVPLAY